METDTHINRIVPNAAACRTPKVTKPLDAALELVTVSILEKQRNQRLYDDLISICPFPDHKEILFRIKDAELKHMEILEEIFKHYTGVTVSGPTDAFSGKPESYFEGIRLCFSKNLEAVEMHQSVMSGLPDIYYRVMMFEMLVEELRYAESCNNMLLDVLGNS